MRSILSVVSSLLLLIALQQELHAAQKQWSDVSTYCFREQGRIENPDAGTVKIRLMPRTQLFFIQNSNILPHKLFKSGNMQYIDYTIVSLTGVADASSFNVHDLYDGNFTSGLRFDPFSKEPPCLVIDAGRQLPIGGFATRLFYRGKGRLRYRASQDNRHFIEVDQPERYSWRYLKICFEPLTEKDSKRYPIFIQELNVLKPAPSVWLIAAKNRSPIEIYSGFECDDPDFGPLIQLTQTLSRRTTFRLNAGTPQYDVTLTANPQYDTDFDDDQILNQNDNCPFSANPGQQDIDLDGIGDACDLDNETRNFHEQDSDHDGVGDSVDNCVYIFNPHQMDSNADNQGDLCSDDDQDGIIGYKDNCITIPNPDQKDINVNGVGDACEFDKDNDGVFDSIDNCMNTPNPEQLDTDGDGIGDLCDNCRLYNPRQLDINHNGQGDRCEEDERFRHENDMDKDGILDQVDNCKEQANHDQIDTDKDGIGDECDNCPKLQNPLQVDKNKNGVGDMCEDSDNDGIVGYRDNCMHHPNPDQKDTDNDNVGDACEDDDSDHIVASEDNCPFVYNPKQRDADHDGVGDACDPKDDRLLESNRWIVAGIIVLITCIFGVLIFIMVRRIRKI